MTQQALKKIDEKVLAKHEVTLEELSSLRYVYDSQARKTYLSGKLEAYEEVLLLIRAFILD